MNIAQKTGAFSINTMLPPLKNLDRKKGNKILYPIRKETRGRRSIRKIGRRKGEKPDGWRDRDMGAELQ